MRLSRRTVLARKKHSTFYYRSRSAYPLNLALMRLMCRTSEAPTRKINRKAPVHPVGRYLLRDLTIGRSNQIWCTGDLYPPGSIKYETRIPPYIRCHTIQTFRCTSLRTKGVPSDSTVLIPPVPVINGIFHLMFDLMTILITC